MPFSTETDHFAERDVLDMLEKEGYHFVRYFSSGKHSSVAAFRWQPSVKVKRATGRQTIRILKAITGEGLEYEYKVGKALRQKSLSLEPRLHLVGRTIDLLNLTTRTGLTRKYLVLEYLRGKTLATLLSETKLLDTPEGIQKYVRMIRTIYEFEQQTGFTHYDLHHKNILTNDNLETFKIIDFGRSHFPGVTGKMQVDIGSLSIGRIAAFFDPWVDLVRLIQMAYFLMNREFPEDLSNLFKANGYSRWTRGPRPEWAPSFLRRACGVEVLMECKTEKLLSTPKTLWKWSHDGFWVNDGTKPLETPKTNLKVDREAPRKAFGLHLARIKESLLHQRPNPDPVVLIDLVVADLEKAV